MSEEDFLPPFPALHRCLLLDNKQWSRTNVLRELKGTRYFEQIMDCREVAQGMRILSSHEFDACFIGPTLSRDEALAFLEYASRDAYSKDCARICLVYENCDYIEQLLAGGAHGVIELPCGRPVLRLGIVRAVVSANADSPWTGILLSIAGDIPEEALGKVFIIDAPAPLSAQPEGGVEVIDELDLFGTISVLGAEAVAGSGADKQRAVKRILKKLSAAAPSLAAVPGFEKFLDEALQAWGDDLKVMTADAAKERLRKRLASFSFSRSDER